MKSNRLVKCAALLGLAGAFVLAGCSGAPVEPAAAEAPVASPGSSSGTIPGYRHEVFRSRFALGTILETKSELGMTKHIGTQGVFAVRDANGAALAVPNADAPGRRGGTFPGTAAEHTTIVRSYFVGAGIPAEQIGSSHVNTHGFGHATPTGERTKPELANYDTVLVRAVDGIRVVDSVAWARLGANGDVVAEEPFWPEIRRDVVLEAKAMRDRLSHPTQSRELLARMGAAPEDVEVVIRHDSSTVNAPPTAHASFDVHVTAGTASYHKHFDDQLAEFRLGHEQSMVSREHVMDKVFR